ncbi:sensor histidine kinase [Emticicia sp. C21]|uniref:sensor histidine kinase n=1 Tax=Emticicia sp. C21 TaxID=2302915 RepID=UPI000E350016|nr:histidine kinase [Emticicia sp. C21]RFS14192.1 histidine kinase [Emticicia sp. C21]
MNRVRLFFFLLILIPTSIYAQINWGDYSQSFQSGALDKPETIALILAIPKDNNSFWTIQGNSAHFDEFTKHNSFKDLRLGNIIARTTFDTAKAQFFLHGVNIKNAQAYQFRVIEYPSQKVIAPWQSIIQFTDARVVKDSGLPQMAYLGGYKAPLGSMLVVDVRKKGSRPIIATNLVAWESISPKVSKVYTSDNLDIFLQKLQYPWAKTRTDNTKHLLDKLKLPATNTNLVFVLNAEIYSKSQVQYQLLRNDKIIRPWQDNEFDNSFIWLRDFSPGRYQIHIRYMAQPQHITKYSFEVEPNWYQTLWFKFVLIGIGIIIVALIVFMFLLFRQRNKTKLETEKKQKLYFELQAVYAQLNPHFVFNALSSIQGLINQQDIKGANEYLSDFARLMRESLANGNKDENPLWQELQMMETYLKLEQLRFGFSYTIQVDEQLDVYSNNLPPLLWQPLLENAVKHGVAPLQQTGQISIRIEKRNDSIVISIADNGKGLTGSETTHGFGLKLTRNRIQLLNDLKPEQPISLNLTNGLTTGTEVTITFIHWLL